MNHQFDENKDAWRLAILTGEQQEQVQQLEKELGISLIAYQNTNNIDMSESPKGV